MGETAPPEGSRRPCPNQLLLYDPQPSSQRAGTPPPTKEGLQGEEVGHVTELRHDTFMGAEISHRK